MKSKVLSTFQGVLKTAQLNFLFLDRWVYRILEPKQASKLL